MSLAYICICSEEYYNHYNILWQSLKEHHPDAKQILYYIGKKPFGSNQDVCINDWYDACDPSYNRLERICSLRARVVLDAFNRGFEQVIFCGAKLEFFDHPKMMYQPLFYSGGSYNAVVTPHILEPLPEDGKLPSNASVSFTGHASTDLVSFKNCEEIVQFLTWQDEIMKTQCKTTKHTYLDQSWLNFLPFFVDNVLILRDPRYNVAYYNIDQRLDYLDKMVCFQYSGLDLENPKSISKYQNRNEASGEFLKFLENYVKRVKGYK